jgi:hypothetical protein
MKRIMMIAAAAAMVGACATTKTMQAIGGSRSDGVVRLAYEYNMFENPQVDPVQALETARSRCKVWGYTDAEAFGAGTQQCQQSNAYGSCIKTMVTVEYQCTGANTPS